MDQTRRKKRPPTGRSRGRPMLDQSGTTSITFKAPTCLAKALSDKAGKGAAARSCLLRRYLQEGLDRDALSPAPGGSS